MRRGAALLVICSLFMGCASASPHSRARAKAIGGAIIGAIGGAVLTAATGDTRHLVRNVAAGAAIGAITGWAVGRSQDKLYASRDQAVLAMNYDPSMGYIVQVQEVVSTPTNPSPGNAASVKIRYIVLGPNPSETLTVNGSRSLLYGGDAVLSDKTTTFTVPNGGGIVETTFDISIPAEVPTGTYTVQAKYQEQNGRANHESATPLYVG